MNDPDYVPAKKKPRTASTAKETIDVSTAKGAPVSHLPDYDAVLLRDKQRRPKPAATVEAETPKRRRTSRGTVSGKKPAPTPDAGTKKGGVKATRDASASGKKPARTPKAGAKKGGVTATRGTSASIGKPPAGTQEMTENVYLVHDVISDQVAGELCTLFGNLSYKPILNPDRLRGQSQSYEMYTKKGRRRTLGLLYEDTIRSRVQQIVLKFDECIVGEADTAVGVKGIYSMEGCKSQEHHPDYQPEVCRLDVSKYWSVIVALEEGTRLEICRGDGTAPLIVSIPVGMALLFRGDVVHGGAAYLLKGNYRLFFKLVPREEAGRISYASTEANERLAAGGFCNHRHQTQSIHFCFLFGCSSFPIHFSFFASPFFFDLFSLLRFFCIVDVCSGVDVEGYSGHDN